MGGGKGGVDHYVYPIRPGRMIFEIRRIKRGYFQEKHWKEQEESCQLRQNLLKKIDLIFKYESS